MNTSQEVTNIFKAICECKKDFVPLQKNKQGYGYKYVTLDAVIDMLNTVLPKHGLGFIQFPSNNGMDYSLTTRVIHESGEWLEDTITFSLTEISKANDTQKLGASVTYFRRYTLSAIFGIAADEDVDGNIEMNLEQQQQTYQRKQFNEAKKTQYQQKQEQQKQETTLQQNSNEFSKEKYLNVYLTNDNSCNDEIKHLVSETYRDETVFTEKTKEFISNKVEENTFANKDEYMNYLRRASSINKRRIDAKLAEQELQNSSQQKQEEQIEF